MTSSLVPEQQVLQLQSLETVACNIPGVHLHNCRVHFVKQTEKQLLFLLKYATVEETIPLGILWLYLVM